MLALLTGILTQGGAEVQVFALRELKLAHCIGCFGCWLETPGICRYHESDGRAILQAVMQSDMLIMFTPVTFGGYSSQLKQIVDRFVSLVLPYLRSSHNEVHHVPRYAHFPRTVAIGVQRQPNAADAGLFKLLAGRNAINFHAKSYAAEVVRSTDDLDSLREVFGSLLCRNDPFPWGEEIASLMTTPDAGVSQAEADGARRARLIAGSPKTLSPSTSNVLGNYLLERLKERGWETESLTLSASLRVAAGQSALLASVDCADLLLFAFPLYVDALPFLMTKALEVITYHRRTTDHPRPQCLFAMANNGFAEAYQSNLALSICQRFAAENGMAWVDGLAMGAGEALCGGQQLQPIMPSGLPCAHVMRALDATGEALARGQAIPAEAMREIAARPIPHIPFSAWREMFVQQGNLWWERRAAEHEVDTQRMLAQPYARGA
jgi:multimeric flavodoxin WrbA